MKTSIRQRRQTATRLLRDLMNSKEYLRHDKKEKESRRRQDRDETETEKMEKG